MTDALDELLAVAGHNSGKRPFAEVLTEELADVTKRAQSLLAAFNKAPGNITDDDTAKKFADLAKLIGACTKVVEDARKKRKAPFLEDGRTVDAAFNAVTDPLEDPDTALHDQLTAWMIENKTDQVRGEYSVASLSDFWDYRISEPLQFDLRELTEHVDIGAAIRKFIKAGGRSLSGVRIFQSKRATVR